MVVLVDGCDGSSVGGLGVCVHGGVLMFCFYCDEGAIDGGFVVMLVVVLEVVVVIVMVLVLLFMMIAMLVVVSMGIVVFVVLVVVIWECSFYYITCQI